MKATSYVKIISEVDKIVSTINIKSTNRLGLSWVIFDSTPERAVYSKHVVCAKEIENYLTNRTSINILK